jgi:GNAT superfamily N-acetyltransferase
MPQTAVSTEQVRAFIADAQAVLDAHRRHTHQSRRVLAVQPGQRYLRIVSRSADGASATWGFLDQSDGCVLRAAGPTRPDPVPRGHLFDPLDPSHGRRAITPDGPRRLDDPALDPAMIAFLRDKYAPQTQIEADPVRPRFPPMVPPIEPSDPAGFEERQARRMARYRAETTFPPGTLSDGPANGETAASLRLAWIADQEPFLGMRGERWRRNVPLWSDTAYDAANEEVLVAYDRSGTIVASALFAERRRRPDDRHWRFVEPRFVHLDYVRVVEPWRRQGVFAALAAEAVRRWPDWRFDGLAIDSEGPVARFFAAHAPQER